MDTGRIVILNGPSRSGKTSIAKAMQDSFAEPWMNIGMDVHITATPPAYRPGVGLRPQRVDGNVNQPKTFDELGRPVQRVPLTVLEDLLPAMYAALYDSIVAHARVGLNVVCDIYHHDYYTRPLRILDDCARRIRGLPVLFVGVRCPIDVIWERRAATWGQKRDEVDERTREAVELAQRAAASHRYDLELDTSELSPDECVEQIRARLRTPSRSVLDAI
jgi:chloramphenicol 3-O phosphotransferase